MLQAKVAPLLFAAAALGLGGCAGLSARTGAAAIAIQTEAGMATSNAASDKEGQSCSQNILGLVALGDSSVQSAKAKGGITNVASIDYKYLGIFVFYGRVCTIVRGT